MAIIGNPPYRRLQGNERETLVGRWMAGGLDAHGRREEGKWDDLKQPVSEAGKGNQLNTFEELSVAFWRWALWKLFEADNAPRRGVVAFITNRKFLTGWPYAGLRKMMRERFDRIEIIDLRGDVRAGPRGDVANDEGVFNIMVGTAITVAIADGSKAEGALAEVSYLDSWAHGLFGRPAKLDWLSGGAEAGSLSDAVVVDRDGLENFRPHAFSNGEWVSIADCFAFASSGLESKRDHIVYATSAGALVRQITDVMALIGADADRSFNSTGMNSASDAFASGFNSSLVREAGYRPLDVRHHYPHKRWNDRPRTQLSAAWGLRNLALFTLPANVGMGPGIWCYAAYPDRHAFRGSYGGYAFPLYDRRSGPTTSNLNLVLVAALSAAYGRPVAPEDVFDAVLALLSATSYTTLHAEDLEDSFPHIPFPARPDVFNRAVAVGREIRAIETFARKADAKYRAKSFAKEKEEVAGAVGQVDWREGAIVQVETRGGARRETIWLSGVPEEVWSFAVSGYRVLPRWIEARAALPAEEIVEDLRDVAQRINELIHRFREADLVLADTLADTLTREELGFPAETQTQEEGDD